MLDLAIVAILDQAASPSPRAGFIHPTYECFVRETRKQGIPDILMLAVLKTEGGKVGTLSRNSNGTLDLGPMQINTVHLSRVAKATGRSVPDVAAKLAYDGCSNLAVGAWILRESINDAGDLWKGVAYYHSRNMKHGGPYAWRVYRTMNQILASNQLTPALAVGASQALLASGQPVGRQ